MQMNANKYTTTNKDIITGRCKINTNYSRDNNHKKNKTEKMIKRNAVTTKRHKLMPMRQNCKDTRKTT